MIWWQPQPFAMRPPQHEAARIDEPGFGQGYFLRLAPQIGYDGGMGRQFRNVAVVKAYDAGGKLAAEDIVPVEIYGKAGSLLLNCAEFRVARRIRFISFRLFDESGLRVESQGSYYDAHGHEVAGLHRMPDGTIIENPYI